MATVWQLVSVSACFNQNKASEPINVELAVQEAPPKDAEVEVDGVDTLPLAKDITVLRGVCSERLKFDIEFSRKRGTTDNCYIVKVSLLSHDFMCH